MLEERREHREREREGQEGTEDPVSRQTQRPLILVVCKHRSYFALEYIIGIRVNFLPTDFSHPSYKKERRQSERVTDFCDCVHAFFVPFCPKNGCSIWILRILTNARHFASCSSFNSLSFCAQSLAFIITFIIYISFIAVFMMFCQF